MCGGVASRCCCQASDLVSRSPFFFFFCSRRGERDHGLTAVFLPRNGRPRVADLLAKLEVVGVDHESESQLRGAMEGSQAVVCALGASESEPFNYKGPYEVMVV